MTILTLRLISIERRIFRNYLIGINGLLTTMILFGYWFYCDSLPENALPNRGWLIFFCLCMSFYIIGDTYLLMLGYSSFLVDIKYIDDYIKIVLKLYIDFFGFLGSIY